MRRYYFDFRDGGSVVLDDEGVELATLQSVQAEAARALADLARDALWGHAKHALAHRMEVQVRDDLGTVLRAKLTFEVVQRQQTARR
jgi:hypothetical protein